MKKILIASLCLSALGLTACDKKTNETATTAQTTTPTVATTTAALSQGVTEDIRTDLDQIHTLSNAKAQEALKFQNDVMQAAQKEDKAALDAVVDSMEKYVDDFNDELEALKLKSSEADSIRDKMKASNELGLDLAEAGIETPVDMNKITELQKKATELQQSLLQEMQTLQTQVSVKSS